MALLPLPYPQTQRVCERGAGCWGEGCRAGRGGRGPQEGEGGCWGAGPHPGCEVTLETFQKPALFSSGVVARGDMAGGVSAQRRRRREAGRAVWVGVTGTPGARPAPPCPPLCPRPQASPAPGSGPLPTPSPPGSRPALSSFLHLLHVPGGEQIPGQGVLEMGRASEVPGARGAGPRNRPGDLQLPQKESHRQQEAGPVPLGHAPDGKPPQRRNAPNTVRRPNFDGASLPSK